MMTTFSAMLSKKEEGLDFSPLHYQFKSDGNFEEVSFADLLQKQNNSKRKDSLSQLGQMGVGFICLHHTIELTEQVTKDRSKDRSGIYLC